MSIHYYSEDVSFPDLNFDIVSRVFRKELRKSKLKLGNLNFIFCSDLYLLKLNVDFLNHDYFTDVITFDYSEGDLVSGDIYISKERVLHNASLYHQSFEDELIRVISHGFLHLLKFNDKEVEEILSMRQKEDELLGKINSVLSLDSLHS